MVNQCSKKCYTISDEETKQMNKRKFADWDKYVYTALICLNQFAYVCNT